MFVPLILGTAREGRRSENAAKFLLNEIKNFGFETDLIDVRDFLLGKTDASGQSSQSKILSDIVKRSDALIIISPEYNHGYPGELKIMLDMLYNEYFNKPVGICGVSIGQFGGTRMLEQLRQVTVGLGMLPIREAIYFSNVSSLFNENGGISDLSYIEKVKKFLDNLKENIKK